MEELLKRIFESFKEVSTKLHCNSDFFELPTYWHVNGIPFLIKKNKRTSKEDIIKLLYENFITN